MSLYLAAALHCSNEEAPFIYNTFIPPSYVALHQGSNLIETRTRRAREKKVENLKKRKDSFVLGTKGIKI